MSDCGQPRQYPELEKPALTEGHAGTRPKGLDESVPTVHGACLTHGYTHVFAHVYKTCPET